MVDFPQNIATALALASKNMFCDEEEMVMKYSSNLLNKMWLRMIEVPLHKISFSGKRARLVPGVCDN